MESPLKSVNPSYLQNPLRDFLGRVPFARPVAITLTLKQGQRLAGPSGDHYVAINNDLASRNLRHFLNCLNAHYLGKKAKRYGHKIPVVSVVEGTQTKRLHYHLMADWPKNEGREAIAATVQRLWTNTKWGYRRNHVELNADKGWLDYMTKLKDKTDLSSSIDWENCFLPMAKS